MREERITEYLLPVVIKDRQGEIDNPEALLKEKVPQIGLCETEFANFKSGSNITLDFGKELSGGVRILTGWADAGCRVRIRFGESVSETCADLKGTAECATATNDHSLRDFETELVFLSDMRFGQTGFRFVRIDFLTGSAQIKNIYAVFEHRDLVRIGSFKCDDELINNIFETAAYTIELCMQDYLWDGIKRDRLVWVGDMHPEMLSICALYGRHGIIEKSLDFIEKQTPLPNWMNNIPMYSMWWIIILADYFELTDCSDYINNKTEYMKGLVKQIDSCIKENGELDFPQYFVDWATHDTPDEKDGVRALCLWAMNRAKTLINCDEIDKVIAKLKKIDIKTKKSKQVLGLKYMATGELSEEEKAFLTSGGAKGMSTFMSYYILKAVAETCGVTIAIEMMKEYFGGMLSRGATTFWEDFDIEWLENSGRIDELPKKDENDIHGDYGAFCYKGFRHSLCHGWASAPVPFLINFCK